MSGVECIVLCGGESKRMKPYVPFNKALVELNLGQTLLEYQVDWLGDHGVDHIILAIDHQTYDRLRKDRLQLLGKVDYSIERERLGTGGAVVKAKELLESSSFYLMNVDDIILSDRYAPEELLNVVECHEGSMGSVLLGRTRLPFGIVETSSSRVVGFDQKPMLDYQVCSGHYAFTCEGVETYFPVKGNFEDAALPKMARDGRLYRLELDGEWITINNFKQLETAKMILNR